MVCEHNISFSQPHLSFSTSSVFLSISPSLISPYTVSSPHSFLSIISGSSYPHYIYCVAFQLMSLSIYFLSLNSYNGDIRD